ncbi:hypothetical protein BDZ97DRAFT_1923393 [Flammula alnicola]|nr:hypothetical protein BDZ97DRAFT_1923393 [Flammula alnicola]
MDVTNNTSPSKDSPMPPAATVKIKVARRKKAKAQDGDKPPPKNKAKVREDFESDEAWFAHKHRRKKKNENMAKLREQKKLENLGSPARDTELAPGQAGPSVPKPRPKGKRKSEATEGTARKRYKTEPSPQPSPEFIQGSSKDCTLPSTSVPTDVSKSSSIATRDPNIDPRLYEDTRDPRTETSNAPPSPAPPLAPSTVESPTKETECPREAPEQFEPPEPSPHFEPPEPSPRFETPEPSPHFEDSPDSPLTVIQTPPNSRLPSSGIIDLLPDPDVKVSSFAKEVVWGGRYRTLLPWISRSNKRSHNLLEYDAEHVKQLAETVKDADECPFITTLYKASFPLKSKLADRIQEELAHGKTVVLKGWEVEEVPLTTEGVFENFQLRKDFPVTVHDSLQRKQNFQLSHIIMPFEQFVKNTQDEKCIQCILDCPNKGAFIPSFMEHLDEGHHGWFHLHEAYDDRVAMSIDAVKTRSWTLLHQPLFHTYSHHDADGYATWSFVLKGAKIWVELRPSGYELVKDRAGLFAMHSDYHHRYTGDKWWYKYGETSDRYAIYAEQGDIIVQAPNAWHEVYSPNKSVVAGGHLYTYNALHLTEINRYYDTIYPFQVTNQSHVSAQLTLVRMLLVIPDRTDKVYYRKPVTALCRMILMPHEYIDPSDNQYDGYLRALEQFKLDEELGSEKKKSGAPDLNPNPLSSTYTLHEDEKDAYRLAKFMVKKYKLNIRVSRVKRIGDGVYEGTADDDYLFENLPWMDPGPRLNFGKDLNAYRIKTKKK